MSQQINLYNPRFRKKKNYVTFNALAALFVLALAGSLALGMSARSRVAVLAAESKRLQQEVDEADQRNKALGVAAPRARDPQVTQDLVQAESDNRALQSVSRVLEQGEMGNTRGYSAYFSAFARSRVQGLWLTGVQILGAGSDIGVQGRTLQAGLLPGYLQGLAREPVLKGKSFGQLTMGQPASASAAPAAPAPAPAKGKSGPAPVASAAPAGPQVVEFSLHAVPVAEAPPRAEAR